ncbi:D-hexose-6-phosphate mutarotase [Pseudomonas sp. NY15374]|uniref:D-hexose-6-phosphate mutarotase n=1 Tax=Pseudomonas sp. NY15374 TaxID=3400357 RepID=UPI003A8B8FC5
MPATAAIHAVEINGLPAWRLELGDAFALISAQGAQLLEYGFHGEPAVIWNNAHARFIPGQPIRGGVPVCWPWFTAVETNPQAVRDAWQCAEPPFHGLVRQVDWRLEHTSLEPQALRLTLRSPVDHHSLTTRLHLSLEPQALELHLEISNKGPRSIAMAAALHSYYAVSDVREVSLQGFAGTRYQDNLKDRALCRQIDEPPIAGLTERVYQGLPDRLTVEDPAWQRRIVIQPRDSRSAVLWNPGPERAASLDQFHPEAWRGMLCIETTRVQEDLLEVAAGTQGGFGVRISREPTTRA